MGAEEVTVRVEAVGLNPLDALVASGVAQRFFDIALPITLGTDFVGVVESAGEAVSDVRIGDRVICWADAGTSGGLAEWAVVPASSCVALPPGMQSVEGACIPTAGITAWHALFSAGRLKSNETVLVHAAAGGVGTFAVQFAHLAGARVIATASGDGKELARRLGADDVIDHRSPGFLAPVSGVDVVLDLVGGETQSRSFGVLKRGGRLVSTVMPPDADLAASIGVEASIFYAKPYASRLGELVSYIAARHVEVVVDGVVPMASFHAAWARLTSRKARGKVVVSVASNG